MGIKGSSRGSVGRRAVASYQDFVNGAGVFNLSVLPDAPLTELCIAVAKLLDPVPYETPVRITSGGNTCYLQGVYTHYRWVNMRWLRGERYRFEPTERCACQGVASIKLNIVQYYRDVEAVVRCEHRDTGASTEDIIVDQAMRYAGCVLRLVVHELAHASDARAGLYFQSLDKNIKRRSKWAEREEEMRAEGEVQRLCGQFGLNMGEYGEWLQPHPDLEDPMLGLAEAVEE
jgi:hypothetical protein